VFNRVFHRQPHLCIVTILTYETGNWVCLLHCTVLSFIYCTADKNYVLNTRNKPKLLQIKILNTLFH
jgi:hypothetical protein